MSEEVLLLLISFPCGLPGGVRVINTDADEERET